jgi:phasin
MTDTTNAATKIKTTKHAASPFGVPDYGIPKFEIPKFDLPNTEMPEAFREMTEKGVAHARDTYEKGKVASEEAADLLKNTYVTVAKGATDYNLKLIEIARTNTRAAFDFADELLGVKSPSEFIELSTAQMRKQFDTVSAQNQELYTLAQKVATEAAEPIKTGVSKAFNKVT